MSLVICPPSDDHSTVTEHICPKALLLPENPLAREAVSIGQFTYPDSIEVAIDKLPSVLRSITDDDLAHALKSTVYPHTRLELVPMINA
jgi:hypothetical protein